MALGCFNLEITAIWYLRIERVVLITGSIFCLEYYFMKYIARLLLDYAFVNLYLEGSISRLCKIALDLHSRCKCCLINVIKIGQARVFKTLIGSATQV